MFGATLLHVLLANVNLQSAATPPFADGYEFCGKTNVVENDQRQKKKYYATYENEMNSTSSRS